MSEPKTPQPRQRSRPVRTQEAGSRREAASRARREAIAEAALDIFIDKGFAAARMDEVASRAGVAKGTIYLHFKDKEALFEEIVRTVLVAPLADIALEGPRDDETARVFLERRFLPLLHDLAGTRRGDVVRLLIAEGARFPRLAEAYHREVVTRGLGLMAALGARARSRGEPGAEVLERFPQLIVSPALVGLIWSGLFQRLQPLDVRALVATQLDLVFGPQTIRRAALDPLPIGRGSSAEGAGVRGGRLRRSPHIRVVRLDEMACPHPVRAPPDSTSPSREAGMGSLQK